VNLTPTRVKFGQACDDWLDYIEHDRKRRPTTVRGYRNTVSCYLRPAFSDSTPIDDITTTEVDAYRERLVREAKLSPRTINLSLVLLHGIFKRAQRVHGLPSNPETGAERQPRRRSGDFPVLDPGDVALLVSKAENARDAALFTFAAFTGLQLGEFAGAPLVLRRLRQADRPRSPLVGSRSKHDAADKLTALVGASADDWRAGARALPDPA
jgi:integrase